MEQAGREDLDVGPKGSTLPTSDSLENRDVRPDLKLLSIDGQGGCRLSGVSASKTSESGGLRLGPNREVEGVREERFGVKNFLSGHERGRDRVPDVSRLSEENGD